MNKEELRVPVGKLRRICIPDALEIPDTREIEPLKSFVGQDRAVEALKLGLEVESHGYNIVVSGISGTGRTSAIKEYLQNFAKEKKERGEIFLHDFCFVFNFANPDKPKILIFKKGDGKKFQSHMEEALKTLNKKIPAVFQSEEYAKARDEINEERNKKLEELHNKLIEKAKEVRFTFATIGPGQVMPMSLSYEKPDEVMSEKELDGLLPELKDKIKNNQKALRRLGRKIFSSQQEFVKEAEEKVEILDKKMVGEILESVFEISDYRDYPEVIEYFVNAQEFILKNIDRFKPEEPGQTQIIPFPFGQHNQNNEDQFLPFKVNLFVDNSGTELPPVIIENHPTFSNLFGRVEKKQYMGSSFTDHTLLKSGSFCLADGGYLIINLLDVLLNPGVWQKLKRTLRSGYLKVEEAYEYFGLPAQAGLKPAEIPINVKVIAVTEPYICELLARFDDEFLNIFRVKAEFNHEMELSAENLSAYAGFIALCCQKEELFPFDKTGIAKVAEFGIRLAQSQKKLSTQFGKIKNLVVEAAYWAKNAGSRIVGAEHVEKAVKEKKRRVSLFHERFQENIIDGIFLIDTEGEKIGHINALVVYEMGDLWFGRPSKVTAKTYIGKRGIVSIEREVELSGPILDKAVLILSGYLASKYAQDKPLSFSATLCFEQSYGPVEGDSASIAELTVLISSLSRIPINQSFAVTGSMNQNGDVQPIGGVNDKIEGFFDICRERGLTGEQGVIIPYRNMDHLMLREDVVEAVLNHRFNIYAVKTADEAMELLMDREIEDIDNAVNNRLKEMMKIYLETIEDK